MDVKVKTLLLIGSFKDLVAVDHRYDDKPVYELQRQCAAIVAKEMVSELNDLPQIPYNIRREKVWREIQTEIENLK